MKNKSIIIAVVVSIFITLIFLAGCGPINPTVTILETCELIDHPDGVEMICPGQDPVFIHDGSIGPEGEPGEQGEEGEQGARGEMGEPSIIEIIDPCGEESSYDEILFRLSDDLIYAVYSDKKKVHLVELIPGHYVTTDGTDCAFIVTDEGEVIW